MKNIKTLIEREFDAFFEFETDNRDVVTSTSAKLFAEHVVGIATAPESPAVQGEPTDDELLDWAGEEQFFLFCDRDEFLQIARAVMQRYAAPQPTEQQPAPDVSALVEALENARQWIDDCGAQGGAQHMLDELDAALAAALDAHRKGGEK